CGCVRQVVQPHVIRHNAFTNASALHLLRLSRRRSHRLSRQPQHLGFTSTSCARSTFLPELTPGPPGVRISMHPSSCETTPFQLQALLIQAALTRSMPRSLLLLSEATTKFTRAMIILDNIRAEPRTQNPEPRTHTPKF